MSQGASPPGQPGTPGALASSAAEPGGLELLGRAGMIAVRGADLVWPTREGMGKDGRTALVTARAGEIRTGDVVVFCKPALAIRLTLLMTLMPGAGYAEVTAALLGDLPLVPWQRPYRVPTPAVACAWREAAGPAPLEQLRDRALEQYPELFTSGRLWVMDRNFPGVTRIKALLAAGTHVLIRVRDGITLNRTGGFAADGSYLAVIAGGGAELTVRVIEYQVTVAGRQAPELFCLITDLLDHDAYPTGVLAEAEY